MPIKPENRKLYPSWWKQFSAWIRYCRAKGRCECLGECKGPHARMKELFHNWNPRCFLKDKLIGGSAVLTVAHLDHNPQNNSEKNVRAYCEGCHNRYDAQHRTATRAETRRKGKA